MVGGQELSQSPSPSAAQEDVPRGTKKTVPPVSLYSSLIPVSPEKLEKAGEAFFSGLKRLWSKVGKSPDKGTAVVAADARKLLNYFNGSQTISEAEAFESYKRLTGSDRLSHEEAYMAFKELHDYPSTPEAKAVCNAFKSAAEVASTPSLKERINRFNAMLSGKAFQNCLPREIRQGVENAARQTGLTGDQKVGLYASVLSAMLDGPIEDSSISAFGKNLANQLNKGIAGVTPFSKQAALALARHALYGYETDPATRNKLRARITNALDRTLALIDDAAIGYTQYLTHEGKTRFVGQMASDPTTPAEIKRFICDAIKKDHGIDLNDLTLDELGHLMAYMSEKFGSITDKNEISSLKDRLYGCAVIISQKIANEGLTSGNRKHLKTLAYLSSIVKKAIHPDADAKTRTTAFNAIEDLKSKLSEEFKVYPADTELAQKALANVKQVNAGVTDQSINAAVLDLISTLNKKTFGYLADASLIPDLGPYVSYKVPAYALSKTAEGVLESPKAEDSSPHLINALVSMLHQANLAKRLADKNAALQTFIVDLQVARLTGKAKQPNQFIRVISSAELDSETPAGYRRIPVYYGDGVLTLQIPETAYAALEGMALREQKRFLKSLLSLHSFSGAVVRNITALNPTYSVLNTISDFYNVLVNSHAGLQLLIKHPLKLPQNLWSYVPAVMTALKAAYQSNILLQGLYDTIADIPGMRPIIERIRRFDDPELEKGKAAVYTGVLGSARYTPELTKRKLDTTLREKILRVVSLPVRLPWAAAKALVAIPAWTEPFLKQFTYTQSKRYNLQEGYSEKEAHMRAIGDSTLYGGTTDYSNLGPVATATKAAQFHIISASMTSVSRQLRKAAANLTLNTKPSDAAAFAASFLAILFGLTALGWARSQQVLEDDDISKEIDGSEDRVTAACEKMLEEAGIGSATLVPIGNVDKIKKTATGESYSATSGLQTKDFTALLAAIALYFNIYRLTEGVKDKSQSAHLRRQAAGKVKEAVIGAIPIQGLNIYLQIGGKFAEEDKVTPLKRRSPENFAGETGGPASKFICESLRSLGKMSYGEDKTRWPSWLQTLSNEMNVKDLAALFVPLEKASQSINALISQPAGALYSAFSTKHLTKSAREDQTAGMPELKEGLNRDIIFKSSLTSEERQKIQDLSYSLTETLRSKQNPEDAKRLGQFWWLALKPEILAQAAQEADAKIKSDFTEDRAKEILGAKSDFSGQWGYEMGKLYRLISFTSPIPSLTKLPMAQGVDRMDKIKAYYQYGYHLGEQLKMADLKSDEEKNILKNLDLIMNALEQSGRFKDDDFVDNELVQQAQKGIHDGRTGLKRTL